MYSVNTGATAPTAGNFQLNATGVTNTSAIYISDTNSVAVDVTNWIAKWGLSTNTNKATVYIRKYSDPNVYAVYQVLTLTANTGWQNATLNFVVSNGAFAAGDLCLITFDRTGDRGATGPTGAQGTQGSQGSIGIQGPQGTQGSVGVQGPQGSQGTQGSLGATGATGPQGSQGTQGSLGIQGTQGTQGSLGITGPTGAQGTQGSLGPTGATGIPADAFIWTFSGPTGATAPLSGNVRFNATGSSNTTSIYISELNTAAIDVSAWLTKLTLSTNPTGTAYLYLVKASDPTVFAVFLVTALADNGVWDTITVTYVNSNGAFVGGDLCYVTFTEVGNKGGTGNQGTQGSIGLQGPQGTQGTQGSLGPTGATGPQGTQGSIGVQGTQGSQGSIGATGGTGYVVPRVTSTGSTLTPAPNADTTDLFMLTAQAGTAAFQATSGTPVEGQKLIIKLNATGATRNITWTGGTAGYTAGGVALPTTVSVSKIVTVGFMYDTNNNVNRWMCVAVATQI
jgi:hypothetical protein